jgi:hypothetical protein
VANLPVIPIYDQTLLRIDKALEEKKALEKARHYLGFSIIGDPCWRKLFYYYRHAENEKITADDGTRSMEDEAKYIKKIADRIKRIEDGYAQEKTMADRLRLLPFIELHTTKKNSNEQISFSLLLDHFQGHCDGVIKGILEAPQTYHIWEHKSVNIDKFNALKKIRDKFGEKKALQEWDEEYYAQAQIYMHCAQLTRHYLTVSTPGGRDYISIRTEYNAQIAENIIEKAKTIIHNNWNIPAKLSEKREFYKCTWCKYKEICHDNKFPLVNCRTCRYREPVKDGNFYCSKYENILLDKLQIEGGCDYHVYNPALISATLIKHIEDGCLYKYKDIIFANIHKYGFPVGDESIDYIYTSYDLREKIKNINNFKKESTLVQKKFDGEILNTPKAWDNLSKTF